ncbi:MAG: hypothetical protein J5878_07275 [Oscillospiraceae bacterium]|nr:hypothetical protein [Oscillospiraceae bacterium]
MRNNQLMNCLLYEDISPEELANVLEITPEVLLQKIFQEQDFTLEEIRRIVGLLGLTDEEVDSIFFR